MAAIAFPFTTKAAVRRLSGVSKQIFDTRSNGKRFAGFPFETAARRCAHDLGTAGTRISHLQRVVYFVRGTRPRTKQIDNFFAVCGETL